MIAYFSAEWGLSNNLPIYAGGLGVLAADILREAADQDCPVTGIGLWYHEGFFRQRIDKLGNQIEESYSVNPLEAGLKAVLEPVTGQPLHIEINFPAEPVAARVWQKKIGNTSLYLLDTNCCYNEPFERDYTAQLYESSWSPRIAQEVLLGVGGVRLLRRLSIVPDFYHINDDHAAFSLLERLREELALGKPVQTALQRVKSQTVFTTHTPVLAAESKFAVDAIWPYLQMLFKEFDLPREKLLALGGLDLPGRDQFSFTVLALKMAGKINAVSARHQQVSRKLWQFTFPGQPEEKVPIDHVTNAVHPRWIAQPMDKFFQKYLGTDYQTKIDQPDLWQKLTQIENSAQLNSDLWQARLKCKKALIDKARLPLPTSHFSPLFLGFARRFAPYKRVYLLTSDLDQLAKVLTDPQRPVYLFVAGKAHPGDPVSKKFLKEIFEASQDPRLKGHLVLLEDYDLALAKTLTSGVDVWLNTPLPPMEASGTSGMKAALNGVLNASVADGWWWEIANAFRVQGSRFEAGWTIGPSNPEPEKPISDKETAKALFNILEEEIVPLYYNRESGTSLPLAWLDKTKHSLVELAPHFNTRRLLREYQQKLYS